MCDLWWFDSIFSSLAWFPLEHWANKTRRCIINSDCIRAPFLFAAHALFTRNYLNQATRHLPLGAWMTWPKPDCLLWPYNLCISTTKWLCGFFRGVCLHCREMGTICMRYGKQKNLSVNLAMWLQVVMSFSICMLLHNVWPLVVWFNILVTSMVPTWTLGQQNQKVYNQ